MERLCAAHCKISPLAEVSDSFLKNHPNPYISLFERLARSPNAHGTPPVPIMPEVSAELNDFVQRLAMLETTPDEGLKTVQLRLQAKYDEFSYMTIAPPPASSICVVTPAAGGQFNVNCAGNTPTRSPKWTLVGSVEQTIPLSNGGQFLAEARARYETRFEADVSYIPETETTDTTRVDLGLSYVTSDDRFTVKAYVDNVTDEVTISNATMSNSYGANGVVGINLQPPRTYGLRASFNF